MAKEYYGYYPPFFGGQQNVLSRQAGDRIIKNDLLQLLRTSKGERVMRPGWGTIINASLFELAIDTTAEAIKDDVERQISLYEPRVDVTVTVAINEDTNLLEISVGGIYTNEPNNTFELELELPFQRTQEQA